MLVLSCFCYVFMTRLFIDALLSLSHWYPGSGVVHDCIDS